MIRVVRTDLAQIVDQFGRYELGLIVATPPMNDTMPDGGDLCESDCAFEPIDKQVDGRLLVRGIDRAVFFTLSVGPGQDPPSIIQADPIDPTGQEPRGRLGPLKECELEARRSTVD